MAVIWPFDLKIAHTNQHNGQHNAHAGRPHTALRAHNTKPMGSQPNPAKPTPLALRAPQREGQRRAVRCAASPLSTKKVRNPPIRGRFLTFVPPTHPVVEVALQQGGLSRVWTAPLRQRSWLSHWREKIFSQEPKIEAALKQGAQHGTSTSDEGNKGRAPAS